MKVFNIILGVIGCLLIIAVMIFANYGGFSKVKFQVKKDGGETLVYQKVTGNYGKTGEVSNKISTELENQYKIKTFRGFGIYFDNPRVVEESKLRSEVGCILEKADTSKVQMLKSKYAIKACPVKEYITAEFPYKGKMSIMIGVMKVYPALMKYVVENHYNEAGPIMEIYDLSGNKIVYRKEAIKIVR